MVDGVASIASVVPFEKKSPSREAERAALLDAVSAAGRLDIVPRAFAARHAAAALHLMGFVSLEELQPDGSARRLRPSDAMNATPLLTWRVAMARAR
jgi:hypothetical protein